MSGLVHSHTVCGMDPKLFLGTCTLNSWILMISKTPSYLYLLPQETKPCGMTVAEFATALLLILSSQHLQNPLPWPSLPPLQLGQLRISRGRRWSSSVICHEDVLSAHWRDSLPNPCFARLGTRCLRAAVSCQHTDLTTAQSFLICCPQHPYSCSPSQFCFLDSPSPFLGGVTPPHPYSHPLLPPMSPCPPCVALPSRQSFTCYCACSQYQRTAAGVKLEEEIGAAFATGQGTLVGWEEGPW